jgi:hypothetical protein
MGILSSLSLTQVKAIVEGEERRWGWDPLYLTADTVSHL